MIEIVNIVDLVKKNGRNVFASKMKLEDNDFIENYRNGKEYDYRDTELNTMNGEYFNAWLKTRTSNRVKSRYKYKNIPFYNNVGNSCATWSEIYYDDYKEAGLTFAEFINVSGYDRDKYFNYQTEQERNEAMLQSIQLNTIGSSIRRSSSTRN